MYQSTCRSLPVFVKRITVLSQYLTFPNDERFLKSSRMEEKCFLNAIIIHDEN